MHIGLFDSGVGGLTVLKELKKHIPKAHYSYLGDTARLPYGNKAPETLKKYTAENIHFLETLGVDCVVIACHSASSVSLNISQTHRGTPVYNVITPSCHQAIFESKNKKIGVIATKATTISQVYTSFINTLDKNAQVFSQACPLLVPLVEEGLIDDEITTLALKRYLLPLINQGIDSLILACTHYPILLKPIQEICGPNIHLVNPATSVAQNIILSDDYDQNLEKIQVYLTDHAPHFIDHAQSLLGPHIDFEILYPTP